MLKTFVSRLHHHDLGYDPEDPRQRIVEDPCHTHSLGFSFRCFLGSRVTVLSDHRTAVVDGDQRIGDQLHFRAEYRSFVCAHTPSE